MAEGNLRELVGKAQMAAEMLKGIAHEYRLLIVCAIGDGERSVQELVDMLGCSQSNVSQHLAKLRTLGILQTRKEANQVFYSVKEQGTLDLIHVLQAAYC